MSGACDADREVRQQLNRLGLSDDLSLDPRRCEQQIDNGRLDLARTRESHGRKPADGVLFDDRPDAVAAVAEIVNQGFRLGVVRQRNCQIGVSREPRFGTRRNGQATHQRKGDA